MLQYSNWAGLEPPYLYLGMGCDGWRRSFIRYWTRCNLWQRALPNWKFHLHSWAAWKFDGLYGAYDIFDCRPKFDIRYDFKLKYLYLLHCLCAQAIKCLHLCFISGCSKDHRMKLILFMKRQNNVSLFAYHRLDLVLIFITLTVITMNAFEISLYNAYCHINTM